jgi:hypothetical protein
VAVCQPNITLSQRTCTTGTFNTAVLAWAPYSSRIFALVGRAAASPGGSALPSVRRSQDLHRRLQALQNTGRVASTMCYWFHKSTDSLPTETMIHYEGRRQRFELQVY